MEGDWRTQLLLLRRHNVVAAPDELFPRDHLGQIGREIDALDPVDFIDAFREIVGKTEPLTDLIEDPEIGLRFAERRDGRRLEDDDAVVELLLAVMAVAAKPRPLADIDALEIGTRGQDDVGELGLTLEPDRLVDHEFEIW